jgi:DNA polymerase III alpha subunit
MFDRHEGRKQFFFEKKNQKTFAYFELHITTNFSFLRGASHVEEVFAQASYLGYEAIAVTDRHSLAGILRAHQAARETRVRLIVGCRVDVREGAAVLLYPTDRAAYARLCRLLSRGKGRAGKGKCDLTWADLAEHAGGMIAVLLPDQPDEVLRANLVRLRHDFPAGAYLALTLRRRPGDAPRLAALARLASSARVPTVATRASAAHSAGCGDVHSRRHANRRCGVSARTVCRPAFAGASGNGAAVRALSGCFAEHAAHCRCLPLQPG